MRRICWLTIVAVLVLLVTASGLVTAQGLRPGGGSEENSPGIQSSPWGDAGPSVGAALERPDGRLLPTEDGSPQRVSTRYPAAVCPIENDFNGTANGWYSHSGTWYIGSEYLHTTGVDGAWASASYYESFGDFDYEARLWRSGCNACANFIVFRGTPDPLTANYNWYHEYKLQYSRDGHYSIWVRVAGGSATPIVGWTPSSAINQGDAWNTLRVVAEGTSLTFYINDTLVWSGSDASLSFGRAGVGMYDGGAGEELRVDWARLCTLPYMHYLPLVMRRG